MQHLEVSGAVPPLKWSLGVKGIKSATWSKVEREETQTRGELVNYYNFP
jgi:hypothetical protein